MRLARRALLCALAMLVLCAAASAQTFHWGKTGPQNLFPSVGTGGPEGGPTGLFTNYEGQALRRGDYIFSVAYNNFDRDPGNLDIVETPMSFNIGLSDYIESSFKITDSKETQASTDNLDIANIPLSFIGRSNDRLDLCLKGTDFKEILQGDSHFLVSHVLALERNCSPGLGSLFHPDLHTGRTSCRGEVSSYVT